MSAAGWVSHAHARHGSILAASSGSSSGRDVGPDLALVGQLERRHDGAALDRDDHQPVGLLGLVHGVPGRVDRRPAHLGQRLVGEPGRLEERRAKPGLPGDQDQADRYGVLGLASLAAQQSVELVDPLGLGPDGPALGVAGEGRQARLGQVVRRGRAPRARWRGGRRLRRSRSSAQTRASGADVHPLALGAEQREHLDGVRPGVAEPVRGAGVELDHLAGLEDQVLVAEHEAEPAREDVEPLVALVGG